LRAVLEKTIPNGLLATIRVIIASTSDFEKHENQSSEDEKSQSDVAFEKTLLVQGILHFPTFHGFFLLENKRW